MQPINYSALPAKIKTTSAGRTLRYAGLGVLIMCIVIFGYAFLGGGLNSVGAGVTNHTVNVVSDIVLTVIALVAVGIAVKRFAFGVQAGIDFISLQTKVMKPFAADNGWQYTGRVRVEGHSDLFPPATRGPQYGWQQYNIAGNIAGKSFDLTTFTLIVPSMAPHKLTLVYVTVMRTPLSSALAPYDQAKLELQTDGQYNYLIFEGATIAAGEVAMILGPLQAPTAAA